MIAANLLRAVALASIPAAAFLHVLCLAQFFIVAAVCGVCAGFFDTAYAAFLPALVGRSHVGECSGKLGATSSVAELAGTLLGGVLVQMLGAPLLVVVNVVLSLAALCTLGRITACEDVPVREPTPKSSYREDFLEGLEAVRGDERLVLLAAANACAYFGGATATAVLFIFLYRTLHLSPGETGIAMGVSNIGMIAALAARPLLARFGARSVLIATSIAAGTVQSLIPFASHGGAVFALILARVLLTASGPISEIVHQSVYAALVPPERLGRVIALMRAGAWGALPLGSLAGGIVASAAGPAAAMLCGGACVFASIGFLLRAHALAGMLADPSSLDARRPTPAGARIWQPHKRRLSAGAHSTPAVHPYGASMRAHRP